MVLSGAIDASALGDGGDRQALGRLEAGDTFNELALMTGDTVLADFIAASRCEVLLIRCRCFNRSSSPSRARCSASHGPSRNDEDGLTDPAKAVRHSVGLGSLFLTLKGERPEKMLVITADRRRSNTVSTTRRTSRATRADRWSALD